MNGVRLLRARDRVARPWKNGGGVTRDVAVFAEGADDKSFLWRASVATIAAAGPFSQFPEIDRTLMLLDGELVIKIGDVAQRLRPGSAALHFTGEEMVSAAPVGEACTVLNIMARRGAFSAKLDRWQAARPTSADYLLLLATGTAGVTVDGRRFDLSALDALLIEAPASISLSLAGPVIAVELFDQFVQ
ncbi:HutD family protein [Sphingopyxis sp.]|uniref:HutD/Ves family protein n=1 Tax=Sphingopyxis sp. TaxID=1908224 RepID=UPI00261C0391|nr:HutD family protein [Sphingopyxis sp.]MCW0198455.1 HutD family protein [Sphingopyxis sp.]